MLTIGYENALLYITQSIDRLMNGEVQITDLVISKLLRQNIEKYTLFFVLVKAKLLDIPINVILLLRILRDLNFNSLSTLWACNINSFDSGVISNAIGNLQFGNFGFN